MSSSFNSDYFDALDRLIKGKPIRTPKGTRICRDAVSLEAGRKRGSIKKGRKQNAELIQKIEEAAKQQNMHGDKMDADVQKYKELYRRYKSLYESVLARELMLVERLESLEKHIGAVKLKKI